MDTPAINDESMTGETVVRSLRNIIAKLEVECDDLRTTIGEQSRCITDLMRHNKQLREAISVLLQPATSELLAKNMEHPSRK
jgi:hypothetical protein